MKTSIYHKRAMSEKAPSLHHHFIWYTPKDENMDTKIHFNIRAAWNIIVNVALQQKHAHDVVAPSSNITDINVQNLKH